MVDLAFRHLCAREHAQSLLSELFCFGVATMEDVFFEVLNLYLSFSVVEEKSLLFDMVRCTI